MLAEIATRLQAMAKPPLASIGSGEDLAALAEGTAPANMAAYVVPFAQEAEANSRATGPSLQRVRVVFLVAVCVRRYGDAKGAARVGATDQIDAALEAALLGWTPTSATDPVELVSTRSQPAKNGVLWHVSTWATARYIEGTS